MAFVPVDLNNIQLDAPSSAQGGGFVPVDINAIKFDAPESQAPMPSVGRTALDQGMQGATFGFADEAQDALGAAGAYLYEAAADAPTRVKNAYRGLTDQPQLPLKYADTGFSDIYKDARGASQARLQNQVEQRPALSIASNLAGGLITGGAGASTKAGAAIANSLGTGGTLARIGKGALSGAATGALYGTGTAKDGERASGAVEGALYGAVGGAAVPAITGAVKSAATGVGNIGRGVVARGAEQLDDSVRSMKGNASQAYQAMRDAGAFFKPETTQKVLSGIQKNIEADGILNKGLHGKAIGVLDDMKEAVQSGQFGIEQLDQWRQLFKEVAGNYADPSNARKATIAIRAIDDAVEGLNPESLSGGGEQAINALKQARTSYAQARRFETISDIVKKSDGDANVLKRELTKLANDPRKTRGFNKDELTALKDAARQTTGEGIMKMVGKFGIDLGSGRSIGNTALPVIGGLATQSPVLPAVGTAARQTQKYLARGKAENLLRTIESGAGAAAKPSDIGRALTGASATQSGIAPNVANKSIDAANQAMPIDSMMIAPDMNIPQAVSNNAGAMMLSGAAMDNAARAELPDPTSEYLRKLAAIESGGNDNAKNPNSSASGRGQFIDSTWNYMVSKYGKDYGLTRKGRNNPEQADIASALYAKENSDALANKIGREPEPQELYMAHFLGAGGAGKLLTANPQAKAAQLLPRAAKSNQSVFFKNGKPLTVAQVYENITNKWKDA